MVDKFKQILTKLHKANKPVALLAILKMDDITDRWSVIFSAHGVDSEEERRKEFVELVNMIIASLDEKEVGQIARVGVFPTTNHLVENLLKFKTDYEIKEPTPVNGNLVHEGYILESNEDVPSKNLSLDL